MKNLGLKINWAIGAIGVIVSCFGILFVKPELYLAMAFLLLGSSFILIISNTLLIKEEKK